jgi:RHS repeat-associated protein
VNALDGSIVAQYEYAPFGELLRCTGPLAALNPFRFSTKFHDDETGLLYYGYRYYDPGTGRWLGRDPLGDEAFLILFTADKSEAVEFRFRAEGLKAAYLFVNNNAVWFVDPTGLETVLIFKTEGSSRDRARGFIDPWGLAAQFAKQEAEQRYKGKFCDLKIKILSVNRVSDVNEHLKFNKKIVEVVFIGHGGPRYVAVGAASVPDSNISHRGGKNDVHPNKLYWGNFRVLQGAPFQIQIWGCDTGSTSDSVAQAIANASRVPVRGTTGLLNFDEETGRPFIRWWRPGRWIIHSPK